MGYPKDHLVTRSIVRHGSFALIAPEGLVNNVVPGFEDCRISILASPKLGASFVHYLISMGEKGQNNQGFGGEGIETFVYCLEGSVRVWLGASEYDLSTGGYAYCPPGVTMRMKNTSGPGTQLLLYKQKYEPLTGYDPKTVIGKEGDIAERIYEQMENVKIKDLLPTDLGFDMNMHILYFEPAGCHPFVETHVQEHGAYLLSGEGLYNLDNQWVPVKKGDYIWFGPFVPQAVYAVGRERLAYIYSKDCNRDAAL
jgi:putative allantoin catabolism protein